MGEGSKRVTNVRGGSPQHRGAEGWLMPFSSKTSLTASPSQIYPPRPATHPHYPPPTAKGNKAETSETPPFFPSILGGKALVLLQIEVGGWREISSKHNLDMIHKNTLSQTILLPCQPPLPALILTRHLVWTTNALLKKKKKILPLLHGPSFISKFFPSIN